VEKAILFENNKDINSYKNYILKLRK